MVGGQAIDLAAAGGPAAARRRRRRRARRHAPAQDRRPHPRRGRRMGAVLAGAPTRVVAAVDALRARPRASRFRSSTTSWTSRARTPTLGKTAGKDAAAGKPTFPALYGLDGSRRLAARLHRARARRARAARASQAAASTGRSRTWTPRAALKSTRTRLGRCPSPASISLLVARGLAATRERARALILAGDVRVDGAPRDEGRHRGRRRRPPSQLRAPDHPWVGRGGIKLDHALEVFGLDVTGAARRSTSAPRPAASPTCCSHAARAHVVALDVGDGPARLAAADRPAGHCARAASTPAISRPDELPPDRRRVRPRHD